MEAASKRREVLLHAIAFYLVLSAARAQRTDPHESRVINAIFSRWGLSEQSVSQGWNTTGDPCSGNAINPDFDSNNYAYNPGITCDCNFPNSTCRIVKLRVYELDVTGSIPDELWTLIYLTDLNLGRNYLSGTLSPAIGNLTQLQYLTFGINALSGEVPRELGRFTDLRSLGLGTNNFSGPLPSELGNCTRLEQLRFQGNSFEGPIPPTFSNLTTLKDLRISELSNGSSTLEFLGNLKNLNILILRNNNISGTIPSSIGEYRYLTQLDLSFNNLTGQISSELFNMKNIIFLILGNNSLTGSLPSNKNSFLERIDLSYNKLSGPLPTWVTPETSSQINLVGNNFESGNLKSSRLNCLQSDFPCRRGSKKYYNFGVNCGGPEIKLPSQPVYEWDNNTLGPTVYYVTSADRWAVSNVGIRDNPMYTYTVNDTNRPDSELFWTSRLSAGSLRYYGLGLMNGNYTVNLGFAELVYEDEGRNTSRSLGRRFFDIYIQGNLVWKDFNIRREAGGRSYQPIWKQFNATVLENYLEIHLFWAGKGTCCVPRRGAYGPSISAISVTPNFKPPPSKKRTGLIVGIVLPVAVVSIGSLFALFLFVQRKRKRRTFKEDEEFVGM